MNTASHEVTQLLTHISVAMATVSVP